MRSLIPLKHPDYRYPASLNPYAKKIESVPDYACTDQETEAHAGRWRSRFLDSAEHPPDRTLHVEIGCNGGHVTLEWARLNPQDAYIGLDWKFKQIYFAAEKARKRGLRNQRFLRAHADRIRYMFAPREIDCLYLYFPDPWPKKAHWKNRTVTAENLTIWASLVRPGGTFHIKTDHPGYFEWMERELAKAGPLWRIHERSTDLHRDHPDPASLKIPEVTLFEQIFIKQGIPIHSLKLTRTNSSLP